MSSSVVLHHGRETVAILADSQFESEWRSLHDRCPWATAFQGPDFVKTWFTAYRAQYSPVLVCRHVDGRLTGLLPLATNVDDGGLVVAGAHQAEYHAWLALSQDSDFILAALSEVRSSFPGVDLTFEYLPSGVPTRLILERRDLRARTRLTLHRRPLMRIDERLEGSFRKKSNKSRFKRLQRCGDVRFERLVDPDALEAVFDDIIDFYDLRQSAVHNNVTPFRSDSIKRSFHVALLRKPDLLHVTVLTVGGCVVAAHLGMMDRHCVYLGIPVHSPFLARHSPGKLHMMLLGRELAREGVVLLDLTPGNDLYKDRFANDEDEVYRLTVYGDRYTAFRAAVSKSVRTAVKAVGRGVGLTPDKARDALRRASRIQWARVPARLIRDVRLKAELRVYRHTKDSAAAYGRQGEAKRDDLNQLLQCGGSPAAQEFLKTVLGRLERGEHVYTFAREGQLLHYGWLIESQTSAFMTEVQQSFHYPEGSAVLYDFYTEVNARGQGLFQMSLQQMLHDIQTLHGVRYIYCTVLATNRPSRHVIEKLGFSYQCSLGFSKTFGRRRHWRSAPCDGRRSHECRQHP